MESSRRPPSAEAVRGNAATTPLSSAIIDGSLTREVRRLLIDNEGLRRSLFKATFSNDLVWGVLYLPSQHDEAAGDNSLSDGLRPLLVRALFHSPALQETQRAILRQFYLTVRGANRSLEARQAQTTTQAANGNHAAELSSVLSEFFDEPTLADNAAQETITPSSPQSHHPEQGEDDASPQLFRIESDILPGLIAPNSASEGDPDANMGRRTFVNRGGPRKLRQLMKKYGLDAVEMNKKRLRKSDFRTDSDSDYVPKRVKSQSVSAKSGRASEKASNVSNKSLKEGESPSDDDIGMNLHDDPNHEDPSTQQNASAGLPGSNPQSPNHNQISLETSTDEDELPSLMLWKGHFGSSDDEESSTDQDESPAQVLAAAGPSHQVHDQQPDTEPATPSIEPQEIEHTKSGKPYTRVLENGLLVSAKGALIPDGYQLSSSSDYPKHPWICPVRTCRALFKESSRLGAHFPKRHIAQKMNDNGDGTFSVVGSYEDKKHRPMVTSQIDRQPEELEPLAAPELARNKHAEWVQENTDAKNVVSSKSAPSTPQKVVRGSTRSAVSTKNELPKSPFESPRSRPVRERATQPEYNLRKLMQKTKHASASGAARESPTHNGSTPQYSERAASPESAADETTQDGAAEMSHVPESEPVAGQAQRNGTAEVGLADSEPVTDLTQQNGSAEGSQVADSTDELASVAEAVDAPVKKPFNLMDVWEAELGTLTSHRPGIGTTCHAFSKITFEGEPKALWSGITSHAVTVHRNSTHDFQVDNTSGRLCLVTAGKFNVMLEGAEEFPISQGGLIKLNVGLACKAKNCHPGDSSFQIIAIRCYNGVETG